VLCSALVLLAGCGGTGSSTGNSVSQASGVIPPPSGSSSSSSSSSSSAAAAGTATVSWVAPTQNSDGTPLGNLAGYNVYYGTSAGSLTQSVQVSSASATSYVVTSLGAGTWYFAVTAYTNTGVESSLSSVVSKTIS
jgi:hypothetical protein